MCSITYIINSKPDTCLFLQLIYNSDNMIFNLFGIMIDIFNDCITLNETLRCHYSETTSFPSPVMR